MRLVTAEIQFTLFPLGMMRSITPSAKYPAGVLNVRGYFT
jgi:hypothetical protein